MQKLWYDLLYNLQYKQKKLNVLKISQISGGFKEINENFDSEHKHT